MRKAVEILDEKLNKYKTKISFSVDSDAIFEAMEEYAKQKEDELRNYINEKLKS